MLRLALASLLLSIAALAGAAEDALRRRADLGAAIAPPEGSRPARIVRFRADSVLEKAGLAVGDEIVELNGRALPDDIAFGAAIRALRGGDPVRLVAKRGENPMRIEVVVPEMRRERIEGLDVRYGVAASTKGYLVRTYTHASRRHCREASRRRLHPVVVVRSDRESLRRPRRLGEDARNGDARIEDAGRAHREAGLGRQCGAGLLQRRLGRRPCRVPGGYPRRIGRPGRRPRALYLFGGSIGAAFVPILAQEFAARGSSRRAASPHLV